LPAVIFIAFTGPKVYELKQKEIDNVLKLAKDKAMEVYNKFDQTVLKSEWTCSLLGWLAINMNIQSCLNLVQVAQRNAKKDFRCIMATFF